MQNQEYLSLKWGTLKAWNFVNDKPLQLLKRYWELGMSAGAAQQEDSVEQKELICQMIDECAAATIHLEWDGVDVSKDEAKRYVLEYGVKRSNSK